MPITTVIKHPLYEYYIRLGKRCSSRFIRPMAVESCGMNAGGDLHEETCHLREEGEEEKKVDKNNVKNVAGVKCLKKRHDKKEL